MLLIIGSVLLGIGGLVSLYLVVKAFQDGIGTGLLSIFVPFYLLYFAFAKFSSPKKGAILGAWIALLVVGATLQGVGAAQAASDLQAELENQQLEFANPPADLAE